MRSVIIFLLVSVALNAALARNLVKRSCCCDNYNECSSSCWTPCNRPRNCNNNNNNDWSPCNNDLVPVLIPFPPTSNTTFPKSPAEATTNNTATIIEDPEPPPQLTVKNKYATNTSHVTTAPLCKLADGTPVACPIQKPVYPIPNQVTYQPAPQPRYYLPTRPMQQVPQVPIQPIYFQQRPVYTFPTASQPVYAQPPVQYIPQPVQQPFQTAQQVPRYVVVPQPVQQFISRMNQGQYLGQYQRNVGAGFWGGYQQPYQASSYGSPCSSQVPWQTPCGSSVVQY